jgi:signal transduction histidine kinase
MQFTLQELGLLDAPPEPEFDNLSLLACDLLDVPMAHVSILDHEKRRIFYKSQNGHPAPLAEARGLPMQMTYCQHVPLTEAPVVVPDAREHRLIKATYASVGGPLGYLGLPISAPCGTVVGGLCLMQPEVRSWTKGEISRANKLAACVSDLIRLRAAMLTSERLRREQRDFTYSISHDLLSPANTVRMILDELKYEEDRLTADARGLINEAVGTLGRMGQQIEDVLAYSRTLGQKIVFEPVNLEALLTDILSDLKSAIDQRGGAIKRGPLPVVQGNAMQLRALLQNLVGNALKFARPGVAPVVRISAERGAARGELCLAVADNGIGIAQADQARVFELFGRLNLRDDYEGTGIGLTLCRRVAENHNGTISVQSDGKTGTTFSAQLPVLQP